jgi:hypothetical protein
MVQANPRLQKDVTPKLTSAARSARTRCTPRPCESDVRRKPRRPRGMFWRSNRPLLFGRCSALILNRRCSSPLSALCAKSACRSNTIEMLPIDAVDGARSRHRVPWGGSSEMTKRLSVFLHRSEGRQWHIASFRCAAIFWQLLEAQRTLADAGAELLGRK